MTENVSGTVNKAIDVLEIFLQKDGGLSLTELAEITGYNKATVYRLVSTLVKRRFLYQVHKNGKYSLGLKMIDCSLAIRRNLKFIDLSYLYLGKINASHNTAVNLTILDVDKSLMVEEIGISSKGIPATSLVTKRLPLHCTACGKILLAFMSEG
jgi:DNA-binding IclR family transcriptional regulator